MNHKNHFFLIALLALFCSPHLHATTLVVSHAVEDMTNLFTGITGDPLVAARPPPNSLNVPVGTVEQASLPSFSFPAQFKFGQGFDPGLGQLQAVTIDTSSLTLNNYLIFYDGVIDYIEYKSTYSADLLIQQQSIASMARRTQSLDCFSSATPCELAAIKTIYNTSVVDGLDILDSLLGSYTDVPNTVSGFLPDWAKDGSFGERSFSNPNTTFTDPAVLALFSDPTTELTMDIMLSEVTLLAIKDCYTGKKPIDLVPCTASYNGADGQFVIMDPDSRVNITYTYAPVAVPLPTAAWLFGSGLLCLVSMARRKKAS